MKQKNTAPLSKKRILLTIVTLALLLAAAMLLFKKFMDSRDPDDFNWEE